VLTHPQILHMVSEITHGLAQLTIHYRYLDLGCS
jgi:hypothetical protein